MYRTAKSCKHQRSSSHHHKSPHHTSLHITTTSRRGIVRPPVDPLVLNEKQSEHIIEVMFGLKLEERIKGAKKDDPMLMHNRNLYVKRKQHEFDEKMVIEESIRLSEQNLQDTPETDVEFYKMIATPRPIPWHLPLFTYFSQDMKKKYQNLTNANAEAGKNYYIRHYKNLNRIVNKWVEGYANIGSVSHSAPVPGPYLWRKSTTRSNATPPTDGETITFELDCWTHDGVHLQSTNPKKLLPPYGPQEFTWTDDGLRYLGYPYYGAMMDVLGKLGVGEAAEIILPSMSQGELDFCGEYPGMAHHWKIRRVPNVDLYYDYRRLAQEYYEKKKSTGLFTEFGVDPATGQGMLYRFIEPHHETSAKPVPWRPIEIRYVGWTSWGDQIEANPRKTVLLNKKDSVYKGFAHVLRNVMRAGDKMELILSPSWGYQKQVDFSMEGLLETFDREKEFKFYSPEMEAQLEKSIKHHEYATAKEKKEQKEFAEVMNEHLNRLENVNFNLESTKYNHSPHKNNWKRSTVLAERTKKVKSYNPADSEPKPSKKIGVLTDDQINNKEDKYDRILKSHENIHKRPKISQKDMVRALLAMQKVDFIDDEMLDILHANSPSMWFHNLLEEEDKNHEASTFPGDSPTPLENAVLHGKEDDFDEFNRPNEPTTEPLPPLDPSRLSSLDPYLDEQEIDRWIKFLSRPKPSDRDIMREVRRFLWHKSLRMKAAGVTPRDLLHIVAYYDPHDPPELQEQIAEYVNNLNSLDHPVLNPNMYDVSKWRLELLPFTPEEPTLEPVESVSPNYSKRYGVSLY